MPAMIIRAFLTAGLAAIATACVAVEAGADKPTPDPALSDPEFLMEAEEEIEDKEEEDDEGAVHFGSLNAGAGNLPYSPMVVYDDLIHLAGVLGFDPDTGELAEGVEAQTSYALKAIGATLARADAEMSDILSCTCYLADIDDFAAFNAAYAPFFPENPPARTTVGVAGLPLGAAVEISCVAANPEDD